MPAVVAAAETESAVAASSLNAVGVGVVAETEAVLAVAATLFRRTLDESITDGDITHDTDHEALHQFHNKFDLRDIPSAGDSIQWDGDSYSPASTESPYAGTWLDALFVRPDAVHAKDDEFVGTSIDAAWTESVVAGTTTWTQGLGRLSVASSSQGNAPEYSSILKAMPGSTPVTVETVLQTHPMNVRFHVGLCFTDGTASTSNVVSAIYFHDYYDTPYFRFSVGTLADGDSVSSAANNPSEQPHPAAFEYFRLVWVGTNSFKMLVSHDAVSWVDHFGAKAYTLAPTHFGMVIATDSSLVSAASFEYVRVTESDLS